MPLPTPHSPFPIPPSPFPIPHSPFPLPHSPFPIPHSSYTVFIQEVAEIAAVDSEQRRRAILHPFGCAQRFQDDLSLGDLQAAFQRTIRLRFLSEFIGQATGAEEPLLLQYY